MAPLEGVSAKFSNMFCIILKEIRGREIFAWVDVTTAAGPILHRLGRATKMAAFWSYFRDFDGAQKIEDLSKSKFFFAEVFQITSRFVLARKHFGVRCTLNARNSSRPNLILTY